MTQTLAEMRARDLVASDAPGRRVRLTAEGEALCARLEPVWRAVESAAAELDRDCRRRLARPSRRRWRGCGWPFGERIRSALEG